MASGQAFRKKNHKYLFLLHCNTFSFTGAIIISKLVDYHENDSQIPLK